MILLLTGMEPESMDLLEPSLSSILIKLAGRSKLNFNILWHKSLSHSSTCLQRQLKLLVPLLMPSKAQ